MTTFFLYKIFSKFFLIESLLNKIETFLFHFQKTRISDLQNFFRVLAGQIAQRFSKIWKGVLPRNFWKYLVFTRIADWGKAFRGLIAYIEKNELEALGVISFRREKKT